MKTYFKNIATYTLLAILLFSSLTLFVPQEAEAATCDNATTSAEFPNGTSSVTPNSIKAVTDTVNIVIAFSVTCTVKNPTGWEIFLTGPTKQGVTPPSTNQIKTWTITKWDTSIKQVDGRYLSLVTFNAKIKPFSGSPTDGKYNFKYTAYDSRNLSAATDGFSLTFGTAVPNNTPTNTPNNTPNNGPTNTCTGSGCGTLNTGDFDKEVDRLINPINIGTFPELVLFVMRGFIFLIGVMSVLVIMIGGIRMVLAQGNQEFVTKGKQTIIWAVAGLIVALLSYSLVSIVQNLLSNK